MRRTVLLTMLATVVASTIWWWRNRANAELTLEPPTWPPLPPRSAATWLAANEDTAAPDGFPIKANESSMIFHVPGGRFYDRTNPERWYATAEAAIADGYRQSKT